MFVHEHIKRVRYAETDKMGYLYYGHYAKYYEIGRVESLRELGVSYKDLEDVHGIMLPVLSLKARYLIPAYYDEQIKIKTILKEKPTRYFSFYHELLNEDDKIINKAEVKIFCIDMTTGQRINVPDLILDNLNPYFEEL